MAAKSAPKKNPSAEKRARQTEKRNLRNRTIRTRIKGVIKAVETSVQEKDQAKSLTDLKAATKAIMSAASKGTIHKNNAARKISRLARMVAKAKA